MENLFMEKIVKRKKSSIDLAIIIGEITACVVLSLAAFVLLAQVGLGSISLFVVVGLIYGTWFLVGQRSLEYEYALTNGELDLDRIVSRRRRKRLFSGNVKEFESVAPQKSVYWSNEFKALKKVIDVTSGKDAEGVWFIVTQIGGERGVILFQPTSAMIDAMWHANPRKVMRG